MYEQRNWYPIILEKNGVDFGQQICIFWQQYSYLEYE